MVLFHIIVIKVHENHEVKGVPSSNSNMNIFNILTSLKWGTSYSQWHLILCYNLINCWPEISYNINVMPE